MLLNSSMPTIIIYARQQSKLNNNCQHRDLFITTHLFYSKYKYFKFPKRFFIVYGFYFYISHIKTRV